MFKAVILIFLFDLSLSPLLGNTAKNILNAFEKAQSLYHLGHYEEGLLHLQSNSSSLQYEDHLKFKLYEAKYNISLKQFLRAEEVLLDLSSHNFLHKGNIHDTFEKYLLLIEIGLFKDRREMASIYLDSAQTLRKKIKDKSLLFNFYKLKATFLSKYSNYLSALIAFNRAKEHINSKQDTLSFNLIYSDLLINQRKLKDAEKIILESLLRIGKSERDKISRINFLLSLGFLKYIRNDSKRALEVFHEAKEKIHSYKSRNKNLYDFLECEYSRLILYPLSDLSNTKQIIINCKNFLELAPNFIKANHYRFGEVYQKLANSYLTNSQISSFLKYSRLAINILDRSGRPRKDVLHTKIRYYFYVEDYYSCLNEISEYHERFQSYTIDYESHTEILIFKLLSNYRMKNFYELENIINNELRSPKPKYLSNNFFHKAYIVVLCNMIECLITNDHTRSEEQNSKFKSALDSIYHEEIRTPSDIGRLSIFYQIKLINY
ncbi:MAG: hypothetical protein WBA74_06920 [Cyclobacteriaceae bacterium]